MFNHYKNEGGEHRSQQPTAPIRHPLRLFNYLSFNSLNRISDNHRVYLAKPPPASLLNKHRIACPVILYSISDDNTVYLYDIPILHITSQFARLFRAFATRDAQDNRQYNRKSYSSQ